MPANQPLPGMAFVHRSADKAKRIIVLNVLEQIHSDLTSSPSPAARSSYLSLAADKRKIILLSAAKNINTTRK